MVGTITEDTNLLITQEVYDSVRSQLGHESDPVQMETIAVIVSDIHIRTKRPIAEIIRDIGAKEGSASVAILPHLQRAFDMLNDLRPKTSQVGMTLSDLPLPTSKHVLRNLPPIGPE